MSENLIDYSNYESDWWDGVGVSVEGVNTEIGLLIDATFGVGGISNIQRQAWRCCINSP